MFNERLKRRGWDSNPCAREDKRFSRPPRYDHFGNSPHMQIEKQDAEIGVLSLAEKEGFEPSRRLSQPTPLAGEPLRPLGYFSKPNFISNMDARQRAAL